MKKKTIKKKVESVNWSKAIKLALKQDKIVKSVFCARCVWLIGNLVNKEPKGKLLVLARTHYLRHVSDALKALVDIDKKIVEFKKKR